MNLIGNNCTSAQVYVQKNKQFNNPFMWVIIEDESFLKLITDFDRIDFTKRELTSARIKTVKNRDVYAIRIDGKLTITFPHHVKDENYRTPQRCESDFTGWDVRYFDMDNYILEKYDARVRRMLDSKEEPMFLLDTSISSKKTDSIFENLKGKKKLMCVFMNNYKPKTDIKHINIGKASTPTRAKKIIEELGDYIDGKEN
jgi:hypothetical protein